MIGPNNLITVEREHSQHWAVGNRRYVERKRDGKFEVSGLYNADIEQLRQLLAAVGAAIYDCTAPQIGSGSRLSPVPTAAAAASDTVSEVGNRTPPLPHHKRPVAARNPLDGMPAVVGIDGPVEAEYGDPVG